MMIYQPWRCDMCGAEGELAIAPAVDALETLALIEERHAIAQPHCHAVHGAKWIRLGKCTTL